MNPKVLWSLCTQNKQSLASKGVYDTFDAIKVNLVLKAKNGNKKSFCLFASKKVKLDFCHRLL